jgi:sugar lactone lactonase YvrE
MSLLVVVTAGSGLLTTTAAHAAGETEWVSRYNGPLNRTDAGTAVALSPDGGTVFVTGITTGSTASLDFATVAYDTATGTRKWVRRYDGAASSTDAAFALAVSPDGTTVFVTGMTYRAGVGFIYCTLAYAADTGATRWVRRFEARRFGEDRAIAIGVSPDGSTVFVTGMSEGAPSNIDYATVAYDAATGSRQWVRWYNGPGDKGDGASSLAVSPDGATVFVTGGSVGRDSSSDYATVAYAADSGATRWVRRYNGRGDENGVANAVAVSPDGSTVFVTGFSNFTYLTVAYAAETGTTMWHRRYRGTCSCHDQANALAVSPDGATVFVTGESIGSTGSLDYATVAYEAATGARKWVRRHNGPANGDDSARSVAVSPDGAVVYVTGLIVDLGSGLDYFTVAYDAATGAPSWHRRYNNKGNSEDRAAAVAVSPDGTSVFVTGQSVDPMTQGDFATVAYAA